MVRRFALLLHETDDPHHDLVLDVGGELRCWRLDAEPALDAGEHQVVVELRARPLEYLGFAGLALDVDCGPGTLSLADHGRLHNHSCDARGRRLGLGEAIDAGTARFWLEGGWLQGGWDLTRDGDRWELVKVGDLVARARAAVASNALA